MSEDVGVKPPIPKDYLGDGLYVSFDGYQLCVTAENGVSVLETVYMDPPVLRSLIRYAQRCGMLPSG